MASISSSLNSKSCFEDILKQGYQGPLTNIVTFLTKNGLTNLSQVSKIFFQAIHTENGYIFFYVANGMEKITFPIAKKFNIQSLTYPLKDKVADLYAEKFSQIKEGKVDWFKKLSSDEKKLITCIDCKDFHSDEELHDLLKMTTNLRKLTLSRKKSKDQDDPFFNPSIFQGVTFDKLEELIIDDDASPSFNDVTINILFQKTPQLKKLTIAWHKSLTKEALKNISFPQLLVLDLQWSHFNSNELVVLLKKNTQATRAKSII